MDKLEEIEVVPDEDVDLSTVLDNFDWVEFALPKVEWLEIEIKQEEEKPIRRKRLRSIVPLKLKKVVSLKLLKLFDEDEEDDMGDVFTRLTDDEEKACFLFLKKQIEKNKELSNMRNRESKLLDVYEHNKNEGTLCELTSTILSQSKYKANEPVQCVLCNEFVSEVYLLNPSKCNFHRECRRCFIFTQSLLRYKHSKNDIACPCQRLGTNCRVKNII
jgi:hypothetical protein